MGFRATFFFVLGLRDLNSGFRGCGFRVEDAGFRVSFRGSYC